MSYYLQNHRRLCARDRARQLLLTGSSYVFSHAVVASLVIFFTACGGGLADTVAPPSAASPDDYWALRLTDHVINLSVAEPTNTLQLVVTPLNAAGAPLAGVTTKPTFTALDAEVTVDETGVVTARAAGTELRVVARLQLGSVTHADTAIVYVTDTAPSVIPSTLSIDPAPPDSARWAFTPLVGNKSIIPVDAHGDTISGLAIQYGSSDSSIALIGRSSIDPAVGLLNGQFPGIVTITATTYAYGTRLTAQTTYTIGYSLLQLLNVGREPGPNGIGSVTTFGLSELTIGIGGQVAFNTASLTDTTAIAIEDVAGGPAPVCTRDISALPPGIGFAALCFFNAPGTYRYRALDGGATGTITVKAYTP